MPRTVNLLVCGGRDFGEPDEDNPDYDFVADRCLLVDVLDNLASTFSITELISGAARGADRLGALWAVRQGIRLRSFHAHWRRHGRSAGPIRNRLMLEKGKPDLVVAFPGGAGTAHMVEISRKAGVKVIEVVR